MKLVVGSLGVKVELDGLASGVEEAPVGVEDVNDELQACRCGGRWFAG